MFFLADNTPKHDPLIYLSGGQFRRNWQGSWSIRLLRRGERVSQTAKRKRLKMFNRLKATLAGIVSLCALAAVPVTCIVVLAIVPERAIHKAHDMGAYDTGLQPSHIAQLAR